MKGTSHAMIGGATGFGVSVYFGASPTDSFALISAGMIAGLCPDLDTSGRLSRRITIPAGPFKLLVGFVAIWLVYYSLMKGTGVERAAGAGVGLLLLLLSRKLSPKRMLTVTGAGIIVLGGAMNVLWLLLAGGYVLLASLFPHRSYTHSLLGLIFFGYISYLFAADVQVEGMFYACVIGYGSHLAADSRIIPGNKQGVKLFVPVSRMEV
ncbi:metal-dependent hydrolase [Lentibacillus lipolyticus]|nr:metal-dependent hydrolase [Lentibacillus lipolyticus]